MKDFTSKEAVDFVWECIDNEDWGRLDFGIENSKAVSKYSIKLLNDGNKAFDDAEETVRTSLTYHNRM